MKMKFKKIKIIFIILINIMLLDSFAAIISDNDGSAFVTKAEFDALKNEFNKQINDYNNSIDGKIDGAIAAYLSGITIAAREERNVLLYNEKSVGYYDDTIYKYKYGRPSIKINATIGHTSKPNGTRVDGSFVKVIWDVTAGETSGFLTNVLDYDIDASTKKITVKKCKLAGFYDKYNMILSANGDGDYSTTTMLSYFDKYSYWFSPSNGGVSYASSANQFDSDTLFKSQYYQHTSASTTPQSYTIDDFCKSRANTISVNVGVKNDNYFIAYDGSTKKLLLNYDSLPFAFLGSDDFVSETTEDATAINNAASITGGNMFACAVDGSSMANKSLNATKLTVPTGKVDTVGIFGGLGHLDGHSILQNTYSFGDSSAGVSVNDVTLDAGMPLLIEKENIDIVWNPSFKDTSKKYRVWLSYEPFNAKNYSTYHGKPNDALDYVDIREKVSGQKYAEITGGTGRLTWNMAKSSIVYMKWAEMDGATEKIAGTLNLDSCKTYISIIPD